MGKTRKILIRAAAIVLVLGIAVLMFVIGRGHTIYIDNKKLEYEGKTYDCPYKVQVTVKGEDVGKLYAKDRGAASWTGQNFRMTLEITEKQGDESTVREISVKLPLNMDGIILNIPALLAGLSEEAYLTEFVPIAVTPAPEDPEQTEDPMTGEF